METESQDKQHQASAKRLSEMRKKGSVPRSRDLTSSLVLIMAVMILVNMSSTFKGRLIENFSLSFGSINDVVSNNVELSYVIKKMAMDNFILLLPLFILLFAVVLASPFLFGGWNFTLEVLGFKFEKLNPLTNLQRIFSPTKALIEIFKSVLKAAFIISVLASFFYYKKAEIFSLINYPASVAIHGSYSLVSGFAIILCCSLIILALADVIYHYFQFQKDSKMSTQELRDEGKDAEGNVEVKRKIRSKQMALIKQRLSVLVPQATVIITNPTHYSVALRYDERKDTAPKVLAKGKDFSAQQIRQIAVANAIPIYEAPALARAIFHTTKIGFEIHPALYMAVALVLSYVHQLKNFQSGRGQQPKFVSDFEIPKEFIYHE